MQKTCAVSGQDMVREFASHQSCYIKPPEALAPRVRLIQALALKLLSHSPATRWASRRLASGGTKFHSGFAPHVCSPYFVATWELILLL